MTTVDCSTLPTYIWVVTYTVWFTDPEEYAFAVGVMGGTSFRANPQSVSNALNVPIYDGPSPPGPNGWNEGGTKGMFGVPIAFQYPDGPDVGNPGVPIHLSPFLDHVFVPCFSTGQTAIWNNRDVYWAGILVLMQAPPPTPQPDVDATIPERRWITGFESEFGSEGGGNGGLIITRDASRTINGVGAGIRRGTNKNFTRSTSVYRTGLTPTSSWERFYLRPRNAGAIAIDIWKCESSPSPTSGIRLYLNIDGSIAVYNVNSSAVETLLTTTPVVFALDVFTRLDLLINYNPLASLGSGRFRLYANGELLVDEVVAAAAGGIGQNSTYHLQSRLGTQIAGANSWELDFDDWTCMDIPMAVVDGTPTEALTSVDWLGGTHIKLVRSTVQDTTGWTGQGESMNQMMSPINASSGSRLTSTTAQAELRGLAELLEGTIDFSGYQIAPVSFIVAKFGSRLTNNGKLGYNLAGAGDTLIAITESAAIQYNTVAYLATGSDIVPPVLSPLEIIHQKGNGTDLATVYAHQASVEYIGLWGTEDSPDFPQLPGDKFYFHNGAYWINSPWGQPTPSEGLTCVHSGTYIGNDTFQDIEVSEVPFHFLFVRPLTGGSKNGFRWFATGLGGHLGSQDGVDPEAPVNVFWDQNTQTAKFTVVGTNADVNALGVVYQWIVFGDPAMRYNTCGAFLHSTATTLADNLILDPNFLPDAVFTQFENTVSASTNIRLAYKGPGNGADDGTRLDGTALANYITFFLGILESHADAHAGNQTTYSAWRTDDGSGDVMVQITSYVGDGTATRDIPLTPASLRFPGLAIVIPHTAAANAVFKDPSHGVGLSGNMNSATNNLATSIKGGDIDVLTVGVAINTLGVTYDVFVIPGSPDGWEQFDWCSNQTPPPIFPPIPPAVPPDIAILPEGGLILGASGGVPTTLIVDPTGIYKYVPGSMCDLIYDRELLVTIDVPVPGVAKGGYIGG